MKRKLAQISDYDLVKMLKGTKDESEAAFTELYKRYSSLLHAYCFKIMNNYELSEDIFQETYIRFYQRIKNREENEFTNVPGYLITIARNLCLNHKRHEINQLSIDEYDFRDKSTENIYERKELLDMINTAIGLLSFEQREAFILREYDGLPYNDIAEICGINLENAKSRVFRAKQKIKNILQPYMKDLC